MLRSDFGRCAVQFVSSSIRLPSRARRLARLTTTWLAIGVLLFGQSATMALAGLVETDTPSDSTNNPYTIPTTSQNILSSATLSANPTNPNPNLEPGHTTSGSWSTLTDGSFGAYNTIDDPNNVIIANNGGTLTYTFGAAYNISAIQGFSGWQDTGRTDQSYTVLYTTTTNSTFTALTTVNHVAGAHSLEVSLTDSANLSGSTSGTTILNSVTALQFVFNGQQNNYVGYRELSALGSIALPSLTWTGLGGAAGNGSWDTTAATTNWKTTVGASPTAYSDTSPVLFDDSGANTNISVQAAGVTPFGVTFSNTGAKAYALTNASGTVGIAGANTPVVISGGGSVTFNSPNTYGGATTISSGSLRVNHSNALQNSTATVNTAGGLVFGAGVGTVNLGALAGSANIALTDTGSAAVNLVAGSNGASTSYTGAFSGAGTFTKAGSGTMTLTGTNTHTGTTYITGGTLVLSVGTPGLYEGLVGSNTGNNMNSTGAIPHTSIQLTPRLGNNNVNNQPYPNGWSNDTTVGYTGYINNPSASAVTYTFDKLFDDATYLSIDGSVLINDNNWNQQAVASKSLTSGRHQFELRFGQGGGGVGPNNGGVPGTGGAGFGYNTTGSTTSFLPLVDPGDGSLLTIGPGLAPLSATASIVMSSGTTLDVTSGSTVLGSIGDASGATGQTVSLGASNLTLGGNNASTIFSGGFTGTGGLIKTGAGVFTLAGVSSHSGATTVSNGTLRLASGSGLGNTAISVASGATLQARPNTGATIAGGATSSLALANGSTFDMAGDSIAGTFRVGGGLAITGGAVLNFDIGTNSGSTVVDTLTALGVAADTGAATINITGFGTTALSNGVYNLITASSGLGTGSFTLGNSTVGIVVGGNTITYNLALINTPTGEQLRVTAPAINGLWTQTGSSIPYSWQTPTNWLSSQVPLLPGSSATFGSPTANNQTINLDQALSVGALTFNNTGGGNYTIAGGSGNPTLGLDGAGAGALITNSNGTNMISANANLNDAATIGAAASTSLTFAGVVSSSGPRFVTISGGTGTIVLANTNTFSGGLTVAGGTLSVPTVNNAGTNGPLGSQTSLSLGAPGNSVGTLEYSGAGNSASNMPLVMVVGGGGQIQVDGASTALTLSGNVTGPGSFGVAGPGTVILTGSGNNFSGGANLNGGTLRVGNAAPGTLGSGVVTFGASNTPTLDLNGNSPSVSGLAGTASNGVVTNSAGGLSTLTLNGSGTATYGGVINKGTGDIGLVVSGGGTQVISGANTFSGGVAIQSGTLQLNNGTWGATNTLTLGSGTNSGALVLGGAAGPSNVTVTNLTVSGTGLQNSIVGGASAVSTLTINNSALLTVAPILGGGGTNQNNLALVAAGSGALTLPSPSSYSGGVTVNSVATVNVTSTLGASGLGTGRVTLAGGVLQLQGGLGGTPGLLNKYYNTMVAGNPQDSDFQSAAALNAKFGPLTPTQTAQGTVGGYSTFNYGGDFTANANGDATFGNTPQQQFSVVDAGSFNAPASAGTSAYTFSTTSDDGTALYIDGTQVVNNLGGHGAQVRSGTITLTPGLHTVLLGEYNSGGGFFLSAQISNPNINGGATQDIPLSTNGLVPGFLIATAGSSTQTYTNNVSVTQSSQINVSGSLAASMGALSVGAATLSVVSPNNTTTPYSLSFTGPTTLTGNAVFNVANSMGNGPGNVAIRSVSDGAAGYSVAKIGAGTLSVAGPGSYSGGTTVSQGTLAVSGSNLALGSNTITLAGGRLQLQGAVANNSIAVHFGADQGGGHLIGAGQSAGAGGFSRTNWNNASGGTGNTSNIVGPTSGSLVDNSGAVQFGTTASWSSGGTYPGGVPNGGDGNNALMSSFLNYQGTNNGVTFTNIPFSSYEVVAYVGNEGGGADGRLALVNIGGTVSGATPSGGTTYYFSTSTNSSAVPFVYTPITNTSSAAHPAGNYVVQTGLTGGSLTVTERPDAGGDNSGLMGVEIINTAVNNNMALANNISVTADSTIDVTGLGANATVGSLSIGANTLSVTGGSTGTDAAYGLSTGAVTLTGNANFNVANNGAGAGTLTLGAVGGSGFGITANGPGAVVLSAANSYSGNTSVTGGGTLRLADGSTNNIAASPVVTVGANSKLDVTGLSGNAISLVSGQTLTGSGRVVGNVVAGGGSTISAVNGSTLTIDGAAGLTLNTNSVASFSLTGTPAGTNTSPLISILNGNLTLGSSPVTVALTGTPSAGTYDLFSFANGTGPVSGLTLSNLTGNSTLSYTLSYLSHEIDLVVLNAANSASWDSTATPSSNNYSESSKWNPAGVPNGAGLTATFGTGVANPINATTVPGHSITVTVNGADTVGTLVFDNAAVAYTLGDGGAGTSLTLKNTQSGSDAGAHVNVLSGSHMILGKLVLADTVGSTFDIASGSMLDVSGVVSSATGANNGLVKMGAGTLRLDAPNTYAGNTTVNAGTLRTTATGALGAGSGALAINASSGATLVDLGANQSVSSLSGAVSGGSATLQVEAGATLTDTQTGPTLLPAGLNLVAAAAAHGGGSLTLNGSGGSVAVTGATNLGSNSNINVNAGTLRFNVASGSHVGATGVSGVTVTVNTGATLALDGSVSALADPSAITGASSPDAARRASIVNDGTINVGSLAAGSQQVGGIDATGSGGSVIVSANSSLTANHINQNTLSIGNNAVFTLDASDAAGNPLVAPSSGLGGGSSSSFASLLASPSFGSGLGSSSSLSSGASSSVGTSGASLGGNLGSGVAAVPEPSSLVLLGLGGIGLLTASLRRRMKRA